MKVKHLLILIIILGILLSIALIKKNSRAVVPTVDEYSDIIPATISQESITGVRVIFKDKEMSCVKRNDEWVSNSHFNAPVSIEKLGTFLSKLDALEGDLRSNDPELLSDYEITDEDGIIISLETKDHTLPTIILAAHRAGQNANFIRTQNTDAVYAVQTDLLREFGMWADVSEENFIADIWVDKKLLDFNYGTLTELSFAVTGNKDFTLIRLDTDEKKWVPVEEMNVEVDSDKVSRLFERIENFQAESVITAEGEYGFDTPLCVISFKTGEETLFLQVGNKIEESDEYFVLLSSHNYVFTVKEYIIDELCKNIGDFFTHDPFGIKDNKIDDIIFRDVETGDKAKLKRRIEERKYMEGDQEKSSHDTVWRIDDGKNSTITRNKVKRALQKIQSLKLKLFDPIEKTAEGKNFIISVTEADKKTIFNFSKTVVRDGEEYVFVRRSDDETIYVITKVQLDELREACQFFYDTIAEKGA